MDILFELGQVSDIDELEHLYDNLNDYLASHVNYAGWRKGVYPVRQTAEDAIAENTLYVAKYNNEIIGSVILSHKQEPAFEKVDWKVELEYEDIFVIYTFVVNPNYLKMGVGQALMQLAIDHSKTVGVKALRLDVYKGNMPAIKLYEKMGFEYIDEIDLGLGMYGLDLFKLYQRLI